MYIQTYPEARLPHKFKISKKKDTDYFMIVELVAEQPVNNQIPIITCYMCEIASETQNSRQIFLIIDQINKNMKEKVESIISDENPCNFYRDLVEVI